MVLHSNRTALPGGIEEAYVLVENGRIIDVSRTLPASHGDAVTELGNLLLMPGIIDPHVHINEPGRTAWEGFDTAAKAALAGGITTLVDMPLNSSPLTTTVNAFRQKLAATKGQLHTNIGFWGGIVPGNEQEVEGLVQEGVLGFKAFFNPLRHRRFS